MIVFSLQDLFCSICGKPYKADVCSSWHAFDKGVCGQRCFYEKEWRRTLSTLGKPYRPDPREYDEQGYPVQTPRRVD